MFIITDENKKVILIDDDREKLRTTALILAKAEVIDDETIYTPMFQKETIDTLIQEYDMENIETTDTGEKYLKGFVPNN